MTGSVKLVRVPTDEELRRRCFRARYDRAFRRWSSAVKRLESLVRSSSDRASIAAAKLRVEAAHAAYRESRDLLADLMLARGLSGGAAGADIRSEVECLARLLWERDGRRSGNSEDDWYRAEQLIRGC